VSLRLDQRFRFDTLVVGAANRLAVAAARAVAEAPGSVYNPLFIYGPSGLGKTHLLAAIARQAQQVQPGLAAEYVLLPELLDQYHAAVAAGSGDAFVARWTAVRLLLVDDVQFLTGRRETQTELLQLFTRVQEAGGQLVLTSDRPPSEIADVDERLIARLSGGLVVDIATPEYETRAAILRAHNDDRRLGLGTDLLDEIARIEFGNVRELQGALNRVVAHQALSDAALSVREVRALLGVPDAAPPRATRDSFATFLSDITVAVQQHVDTWKARLGEAIAFWQGEGYRTGVLERALALPKAPDVDGLVETYGKAVAALRELEARATAVDPTLGSHEAFRDPERLAEAEVLVERALSGQLPPPGPSPAFARALFEVGPSNQLAVKAADAVAQQPAARYNPLLVHGPSGVGKTHLVHAIGNEIAELSGGQLRVACVGTQRFVDELIAAIRDNAVDRWRARYRAADVLVLDDVQFVAGKERTQEELFHLFNALLAEGKQVVLSSDRAPREVPDLAERLVSRFEGGLVVPIDVPDRALREKLVARTLEQQGRPFDPELLRAIADKPVQNVRELLGLVNRLLVAADAAGVPLTAAVARTELGDAPAGGGAPPPRASGTATFLDREKVVWEWPDATARLIEELR
jgi:chromosomal replication initiation ATPase DnaA